MNQDMKKILTGHHSLLKNLNSKAILKLIRTKAPVSGSNLAEIADMRLSAVHHTFINLDKKKLPLKIDNGNSIKLGGRRPSLWRICGQYRYVASFQLEIN